MIELYINKVLAELPPELSFTFVMENPYFTSSSNSTLTIELSMNSQVNRKIFRHYNRLDTPKSVLSLPAVLINNNQVKLRGTAIVNSVTDETVSIQLVSGNSEFNFRTNDDVYIDRLDLGETPYPSAHALIWNSPEYKPEYYGAVDQTDSLIIQSESGEKVNFNMSYFQYKGDMFTPLIYPSYLCAQPYLTCLIKKIVESVGYTVGQNDIDKTFLRNLYVVSSVQSRKIATALPHWTISDFLDEIEKFCQVITVVDEGNKVVNFYNLADFYKDSETFVIPADDVVAAFTVNMEDVQDKDISTGNVGYDLPSLDANKYDYIDEAVKYNAQIETFSSYADMETFWNGLDKDEKPQYIFNVGERRYINYRQKKEGSEETTDSLKEVDLFRNLIRDEEDESVDTTLKIVPVALSPCKIGLYEQPTDQFFGKEPLIQLDSLLPVSSYKTTQPEEINVQDAIEGEESVQGEDDGKGILEVAFSTGTHEFSYTADGETYTTNLPIPFTDYNQKVPDMTGSFPQYSLSLNSVCADSIGSRIKAVNKVDTRVSYEIDFIYRKPNIDATKLFLIANQLYQCKQLEVEVDKDGFSSIYKGVFYRVQ